MSRPRRNPFYAILGVVGFLFVITAASYCVTVLRGVRPASMAAPQHPLDRLMADHGTTTLVVELVILAMATFLTIATDEWNGRELRRVMKLEHDRRRAADDSPLPVADTGGQRGADGQPPGARL